MDEFLDDNNKEELADILEVLYAICDFKNFKFEEIEIIRKEKTDKRGQFKNKIILDRVK